MQLNSGAKGDGDAPCIPVSSGNKSFDMDHAMHVSLLGNLQNAHQSDIARYSFDVMGHATGREIEENRRIREEIVNLEVFRQLELEEEQLIRKILMEREVISMPRVGSLVDSLLRRDVSAAPLLSRGDGFRPGIGLGGGTEGRLSSVGWMDDGGFGGFHLQGLRRSVTGSGGVARPIIDFREEQVVSLVNGAKDDGSCPNSLASSGNKTFYADRPMHVDLPVTCQNTHQSDKTRDPSDLTELMIGRETRNRRIREEMETNEVLPRQKLEEEVMKKMRMERQIYMSLVGLDSSLVDPTLLSYVPEVPLPNERDEFGTGIKSGTELAGGIDGRLFMAGSMENGGIRDFPFQGQPRSVVEDGAAVKPIIDSRKEQLVSMVKPSSSDIAGMKRVFEAPVPQVVEDNTPSVNLRKMSQEGLVCDLCKVAVPCKQAMKSHLNGKKHRAKETALQGTSKTVRENDISKPLVDGSEDSKGNKDDGSCPNSLASSGNKTFYTDRPMHVDLPVTCQNTHQSDKTRDPSDLTELMIGRETRNMRIREEMETNEVLPRQKLEEEVMKKMRMERQIYMSLVGLDSSLVDPTLLSYVPEVPLPNERDEFGTGIKSGTELAGGIDGRFMAGSMEDGGIRDFPFQGQPRWVVEDGAAVKPIIDSRKEQLVSMVKPSSSDIAGMKRVFEAPVPQVVEDNTPSVNLRKMSQEGLVCDLCQVAVPCKQTMKTHLNGKKHRAKETALQGTSKTVRENDISKQSVYGSEDSKGNKDVDVVLPLTERLENKNASAHYVKERPTESNADSKFYCGMCNFGTMSEEVMADHRMGEHHCTLLQQNGGCVIAIKTTPDH